MPRTAARFTQAAIRRAVQGAKAAGLTVGSVKITPAGEIEIVAASEQAQDASPLDQWLAGKRDEARHAR